jgi:hypothetical protein
LDVAIPEGQRAPDPGPASIGTIGIPTYGRPEGLRRCLSSYMENARQHGRTADFVVADNSDSPAVQEQNRSALRELSAKFGMTAAYCGPAECESYIDSLAAASAVPKRVVEYALRNTDPRIRSAAANRNLLLLHGAGNAFFGADDDTTAELYQDEHAGGAFGLSSAPFPPVLKVVPDAAHLDAAVRKIDGDLIGFHQRYLGRRAADLLSEARPAGVDFENVGPALVTRLLKGQGRCSVTWMGIVGDPGMTNPAPFLFAAGPEFDAFVATEAGYRQACVNRHIFRGARAPVLTDAPFCQTVALAYDARDLLPPFAIGPWGAEILFGFFLRTISPESLLMYLPQAIRHAPWTARQFEPEDLWRHAGTFTFASLVIGLISRSPYLSLKSDPAENLRSLGQYLMSAARMSLTDFEEAVRVQQMASMAASAQAAEMRLRQRNRTPAYWAQDVERNQAEMLRAMKERDLWMPDAVLAVEPDPERAATATREFVFRLGELLWYWPSLWDGALGLKKKGIGPGRRL